MNYKYLIPLALLFTALLAACSSTNPAAAPNPAGATNFGSLTQTDGGPGGVLIEATWVTPEYLVSLGVSTSTFDPQENLGFALAFTTHSGDLSGYDLTALALLQDDQGNEHYPLIWESWSDDSHHRAGMLLFPLINDDGHRIDQGGDPIELVIRGIAGVPERVYRWEL